VATSRSTGLEIALANGAAMPVAGSKRRIQPEQKSAKKYLPRNESGKSWVSGL
jgi:hypothetical protein